MKKIIMLSLCAWSFAALGVDDKFPKNKWFNGMGDLEEAKQIQAQTGADIVIYFARSYPADEKGLCGWWEKRGLNQPVVTKYLQDYIKVKVLLPLGKKDQELLDQTRIQFNKTPAVFVIQTNGWSSKVAVFDWPQGQPKLYTPDEIVENIRAKSGERYQPAAPEAAVSPGAN